MPKKKPLPIPLVDDWKDFMKWISTWCFILATSIQTGWLLTPEDLKASIPTEKISYMAIVTIAINIIGVFGRLVKQNGKK